MNITDPLVLRSDVILVPVATLPAEVRGKFDYDEGDYTLSRRHGRMPSQVIDGETASLLSLFRTPRTIADAIVVNSRDLRKDPEIWLDELLPHLGQFLRNSILVPAGSEEEREMTPSLADGTRIGAWTVAHCVSLIEDSEIYRVRSVGRVLNPSVVEGDSVATADGLRTRPTLDAALKIARRPLAFEPSIFGNEARILDALGGAPAPRLYDRGVHEERPYLVIEWCSGMDASAAAAHRRHARRSALELACGIAEAYAALHERGVLHGDVHPRNIFVADDGTTRIIDFGLAAHIGQPSRIGRGGMYYFFEPEYFAGLHRGVELPASPAGEQYALAALLYVLLTGSHYVEFRIDREEMMRQVETEAPLPFARRDLPPWPEVEAILTRALSKDPAQRFPDVRTFAAALRAVLDAETAQLRATPLSGAAPEFLEARLREFARGGAMFAAGFTEAPTASINYGSAGAAVGLLRIAESRHDPRLLALADVWRSRAAREVGTPSGWYNEDLELKAEQLGTVTPYHTESGMHAAAALIAYARGDAVAHQAALEGYLRVCTRPCDNLDLTLGQSATLLGAALLLDTSDSEALRRFGDETMAAVWRALDEHPPIARDAPDAYLGVAHGWSGFLYAALRWCAASGSALPASIERRLDELIAVGVKRGRAMYWRRQVGGHPQDVTSGWCNGTAGHVFTFTAAYDAFGDERFLRVACEAGLHASEETFYNADLCCGTSGRAYAMLNLYKHTGDHEWLGRARTLANHAVAYDGEVARTNSLWKGEMGVAALIADLQSPENARMPFFE